MLLVHLVRQVILGLQVVREHKVLLVQPVRLDRVVLVQPVWQVDQVGLGLRVQQVLQEVQVEVVQLDRVGLAVTPERLVAWELLDSQAQLERPDLPEVVVPQEVADRRDLLVALVQRELLAILEKQVRPVFQGRLEIPDRRDRQVCRALLA